MDTSSQADFTQLAKPFIDYSRNYNDKIQSTLLTKDDLKQLYQILAKKANEAADKELQSIPTCPENIKAIFKNLKDKLWIEIWGENNEYISGDHESIFNDIRLPKKSYKYVLIAIKVTKSQHKIKCTIGLNCSLILKNARYGTFQGLLIPPIKIIAIIQFRVITRHGLTDSI